MKVLSNVIKNFKKFRYLMFELVKKDIKLKYRRSYLGILWTLLEPLLTMIVLTIVFSGFYGKSDRSFPIYVLSGRLLYSFFSSGTKAACKSIRSNASIIKKVYVPKYIYPFSTIIANYLIFLVSLSVLVVVSLVLGVYPTRHIFAALIPLVTLLFMTIGVGMVLATMAVFFRDLEYLWEVMLMLIMYSSAIFYNPAKVIKHGYGWIIKYNPVYACIDNFRNAIYGSPVNKWSLFYSVAIAASSVVIGLIVFYKKQDKFILNI